MNNDQDLNLNNIQNTDEDTKSDTIPSTEGIEPDTVQNIDRAESGSVPENIMIDGESRESEKGKKSKFLSAIHDYVEIFALSIIAVLLIFTFCVRLCRVDGNSMNQTLSHGEMLITTNLFYTPKQGDIVVFHLSNRYYEEPLVKRVIAVEGQTVEIDLSDCVITVDDVLYEDEFAYLDGGSYVIRSEFNERYMHEENGKLYFRAEVPDGKLFVLGDNRNHSSDSRAKHIGFIDEDCVLGKAVVRLSPFGFID